MDVVENCAADFLAALPTLELSYPKLTLPDLLVIWLSKDDFANLSCLAANYLFYLRLVVLVLLDSRAQALVQRTISPEAFSQSAFDAIVTSRKTLWQNV